MKMLLAAMILALLSTAVVAAEVPKGLVEANVLDFGAKADGKTDDTDAFQKALDSARDKGGIVLVPAGTYLVAGTLTIPQGVILRGVWEAPHHADIGKGSVVYATAGEGREEGTPFITMSQSSCLRGLTIYYPNQDADSIKPYPWTIRGGGMHNSVIDVTLVNPYKGIDFGTNWNELHYINNVYGCPLKIGIFINNCTDIGRVENVHFNPHYWGRAAHPSAPTGEKWNKLVKEWLPNNLVGFLIGQTDWEYMSNCFVIFPKIGYHFVKMERGGANAMLTQCGSDIGPVAVQVDNCQPHSGIAFVNSQIMATVIVSNTNSGPVKFSNCGFWPIATTDSQAICDSRGTVTFTSCHFAGWGRKDPKAPCIKVGGGSVIVNGCEFFEGRPQVELGAGVKSAAIFGNRFRDGERIVNNAPATAKVQIGLNVE